MALRRLPARPAATREGGGGKERDQVHVLSMSGPMRDGLWISTAPIHVLRSYTGRERERETKWGRRAPPAAAVWGQSGQGCAKKEEKSSMGGGGEVLPCWAKAGASGS